VSRFRHPSELTANEQQEILDYALRRSEEIVYGRSYSPTMSGISALIMDKLCCAADEFLLLAGDHEILVVFKRKWGTNKLEWLDRQLKRHLPAHCALWIISVESPERAAEVETIWRLGGVDAVRRTLGGEQ
jgi:hypothetical protein